MLEAHIFVWTDSFKLFKQLKLIPLRDLFYYLYALGCRRNKLGPQACGWGTKNWESSIEGTWKNTTEIW